MPVSSFLALNSTVGFSTTIAAGSNGASLPQATINVASASSFPSSGQILVTTASGQQRVTYTSTTSTTFAVCTGGTGAMSTGGSVTTGAQLKSYTNTTPSNVGVTFGTLDVDTTVGATAYNVKGSAIVYEGYRTFLAVTGGKIYQSTDGGSTWTSVRTLTTIAAASQGCHSGLRVASAGGSTVVFICYSNGSTSLYTDYSTDGGATWTTVGPTTVAQSTTIPTDGIFWNGKFYQMFQVGSGGLAGNTECLVFDPNGKTNSIVSTGLGTATFTRLSLCVFNGNLYALFATSSTAGAIFQLVASTWTNVKANFRTVSGNVNSQMALFAQGGFMWAITNSSTTWTCDKFDTGLTLTSSSASIPAAFNSSTARIQVLADSAQGMGSEPQIYVYYSPDGASSSQFSVYQWNGTSVMTLVESGGVAQDALGIQKVSGGASFWQSGNDHVEILSRTGVSNGIKYTFKLYSSSGTDSVSLRGWFRSGTQSYAYQHATLVNPSAGTVSGQNVIGLTADGSTSYTVTWSSVGDGLASGASYSFFLEQF